MEDISLYHSQTEEVADIRKYYQWKKIQKRLWPKEQHRGSDNSSTRTGLKHQIHRGRSLSQPTGPKLQTIIKGPQETVQHIVPGCKMQAWTTYTRHKWEHTAKGF